MKILKPGIALAVAMLAPLFALRAAAQEAAWAAPGGPDDALSAIRRLQTRTKKAPKSKPEAVGPSAPDASWQKIVGGIKAKGSYTPQKSMFKPARFWFRDILGDEKADHGVASAAILGTMNEAELFEPKAGEFLSEEWKLGPDGKWSIDQWTIETDVYGTVEDASHKAIVKTAEMKVESTKDIETSASDAALAAKFKAAIAYWAAKQ